MKQKLLNEIFSNPGYSTAITLGGDELPELLDLINAQWLSVIHSHSEMVANLIHKNAYTIADYHKVASLLDHSRIWKKSNRLLGIHAAHWLNETNLMKSLKDAFGEFTVSDEERIQRPNFYWRLCRPNEPTDVGPLHRDSWFWEGNSNFGVPSNFERVKVWIPLIVDPGLNGLVVEPNSHHRRDISCSYRLSDGIRKPSFDTQKHSTKTILLHTPPGSAVLFHDRLLHAGAVNRSTRSRVSIEFTILLRGLRHD
jgi:hypothetical protein